jgi:PIN domain nuclease of toxin-antitoxin system
MRVLLDTHTLLWWHEQSPKLSSRARTAIADVTNAVVVSVATAWEIVVKRTLGKLQVSADLRELIDDANFEMLPIRLSHLEALAALPMLHRDPFDRMLIAQAIAEGIPLVTGDRAMRPYPAAILW